MAIFENKKKGHSRIIKLFRFKICYRSQDRIKQLEKYYLQKKLKNDCEFARIFTEGRRWLYEIK